MLSTDRIEDDVRAAAQEMRAMDRQLADMLYFPPETTVGAAFGMLRRHIVDFIESTPVELTGKINYRPLFRVLAFVDSARDRWA